MGLFKKKPKPEADPAAVGAVPPPPNTGEMPTTSAKQGKPPKGKKFTVDPVDFLALRAELMDVKARLEAAEQAKAIVESRLAALDATTTALSSQQQAGGVDTPRIAALENQLEEIAAALSETRAAAEEASAAAAASAATAATAATVAARSATAENDMTLIARLDELAAKVDQLPAGDDPDGRIAALEARLAEVGAQASAAHASAAEAHLSAASAASTAQSWADRSNELMTPPPPPPPPEPVVAGPDPETLARLEALSARVGDIDALAERVGAIDQFSAQLAQLNARVAAQAELGAQLSSLRDRINELQNDTTDRRAAALAASGDAELRDRVNGLSDRMTATEALLGQLGQLAERMTANDDAVRRSSEQVAALEQRVDSVSTELANQLSELGRDIDGLAQAARDAQSGTVDEAVVEALRSGQIKLANEQARYEIAFREDLAALAEHVRRGAAR